MRDIKYDTFSFFFRLAIRRPPQQQEAIYSTKCHYAGYVPHHGNTGECEYSHFLQVSGEPPQQTDITETTSTSPDVTDNASISKQRQIYHMSPNMSPVRKGYLHCGPGCGGVEGIHDTALQPLESTQLAPGDTIGYMRQPGEQGCFEIAPPPQLQPGSSISAL